MSLLLIHLQFIHLVLIPEHTGNLKYCTLNAVYSWAV